MGFFDVGSTTPAERDEAKESAMLWAVGEWSYRRIELLPRLEALFTMFSRPGSEAASILGLGGEQQSGLVMTRDAQIFLKVQIRFL